ncbi:serine kinase [Epibacterium sp. SM1979]|uniref:Serine kinase n=1 Tax=Tritonibacter litoralis TaxID=2662264 RepID=A0A843YG81_9RHOB|nr:HPr kinase/phosphatase C-terminal domain-containing protein [Tritonibacter litoralis]MQQ08685.1 serine kinase [Tritonibacter litoralis]
MKPRVLHASCVVFGGRAVLILGASGSGKSSLALQLLAYGATLVSDDRTEVMCEGHQLVAKAPAAISGLIEARGLGILRAETCEKATVCAIVTMDEIETERLPPKRCMDILSVAVPVFHKGESPSFAAGVLQFLKGGALDPDGHP